MIKAVSVFTMQNSDKNTILNKTSAIELMSNAAYAIYDSCEWNDNIYIISGKGNNGGDGIALCNILVDKGFTPSLFLFNNNVSNDSKFFLDKLIDKQYKNIFDISECDYNADIIVDCILGTGFKGELKKELSDVIKKVNSSHAYIVSADIPSGLNGDNGIAQCAVKANKTIAIQFIKSGHVLNSGKDYVGELVVKDIGIDLIGESYNIIENKDITVFKKRLNNSNKGSYGKSLIIGGCIKFAGALKLANMGVSALRMGSGLNMIATPKSIANFLIPNIVESTFYPLSEIDGYIKFVKTECDDIMKGVSCVAIGMGIGDNFEEVIKLIDYIIHKYRVKVLIDADGLNALSNNISVLDNAIADIVVTPHPKEMSRLAKIDLEEVLNNPIEVAENFAINHNVTVLLKGSSTIVTNGVNTYFVTNGGPELSKGGSGDTLSGVILGLLAQNDSAVSSCYVGAYLCAEAAKNAKEIYSEYGVLASDVAKEISNVSKKYN